MTEPRFESADAFLTSLTHELVQHGTKSNKINSFRLAAADNPDWSLLAETAIDLRDAYEKHRQAGRRGDTSSTGTPSALAGIFAIARPSVNSIGAFVVGVALMCVVWASSSTQEPAGAQMAIRDSTPQGGAAPGQSPSSTSIAVPTFALFDSAMARRDLRMPQINAEKWEAVKIAGDQRMAQEGSLDPSFLVQALRERSLASVQVSNLADQGFKAMEAIP